MPIFVELTDFDSGKTVWVNTSKVITMYTSSRGGSTMLCIDGDANFDVKETPEKIMELAKCTAYNMGIR